MKEKFITLLSDKRFQAAVVAIAVLILQQYVGGVDLPVVP